MLCAAIALWGMPSWAEADAPQLIIAVEDPRGQVDPLVIRDGLASDLGVDVALQHSEQASLVVRVSTEGAIEIIYRTQSEERRRELSAPPEPREAERVIVLVAANLAREEADELLARWMRAHDGDSAVVPQSAAAELATADPDGYSAFVLHDPSSYPASLGRPRRPRRLPSERHTHFSVLARGGAAITRLTPIEGFPRPPVSDAPVGFLQLGFELGWALDSMISIGVIDFTFSFGFSDPGGVFFSASLTPYLEVNGFIDPRIQVYGRGGIAAQIRSQTWYGEDHLQLALYGAAGIRFFATDSFAIGLELALHLVLTDAYQMGNFASIDAPPWATPGSGTLSANWFF